MVETERLTAVASDSVPSHSCARPQPGLVGAQHFGHRVRAMSNGIPSLSGDDDSGKVQARTHIQFENPEHGDTSIAYTNEEDAQDYYDAAVAAKEWGADRDILVGKWLDALNTMDEDSDLSDLAELIYEITQGAAFLVDEEGNPIEIETDSDDSDEPSDD